MRCISRRRSSSSSRAGGAAGTGVAEAQIDRQRRDVRFADVLLSRPTAAATEVALIEIIDWFDDVGAPIREWPRRLGGS